MVSIIWIAVALILGAIELFTLTFILLWIAVAALLTGVAGFFVPSLSWQVGIFALLSIVLLLATWRFSARIRNRPTRFKSRVDETIGERAEVVEGWSSGGGGLVKIHGEVWSARGKNVEDHFLSGEWVQVVAMEATQLMVVKIPKEGGAS